MLQSGEIRPKLSTKAGLLEDFGCQLSRQLQSIITCSLTTEVIEAFTRALRWVVNLEKRQPGCLHMHATILPVWGWGYSSVGRASDRHFADACSIPRCGKFFFFFFQSQLLVQTYGVRTPSCAIACTNICAHVKDPVVHVRVRWIKETLKHPAQVG